MSELVCNGNLTSCQPVAAAAIARVEAVANVVEVKLGTYRNVLHDVVVEEQACADVVADQVLVSLVYPCVADIFIYDAFAGNIGKLVVVPAIYKTGTGYEVNVERTTWLLSKIGEVYHQIYRGRDTNEQLYQKISDTLTVLATGGELG